MWAQRGISEMKPLSGQGLVRIGGGKKKGFSIILPTRCNTSHPVSSAVPARLSESPRPQTETRSQVPEFPSFFARIQQYRTRILLLAKHNASEFQVITQKHNYGYYIRFLTLYPPKSHTLNIQTVCLEERCLIMEQQISMRITILQIIHTLDYYSVIINEHGESCMFLFFFFLNEFLMRAGAVKRITAGCFKLLLLYITGSSQCCQAEFWFHVSRSEPCWGLKADLWVLKAEGTL